jgi:NAD(P)-dependent dehydrogenase (short-subunit alcohol dehydrogenase family)
MTGRLDGSTALVTGASSGIGLAAARGLVSEGARVVLAARRASRLERVSAELGSGTSWVETDVADPEQVARMVDVAEGRLGRIDVLVHSAGVSRPAPLEELTPQRWQEVIAINLSGCYYVCREVGLRMRDRGGGTIVNVASESSLRGEPMYVAYCASKGGVLTLTKALAAELAPTVRVNAVCPGSVDTPMLRDDFASLPDPAGALAATRRRIPLGRFATPEEVAAAIVWLVTDATFATGLGLNLDGGTTAVLPSMV